MHGHPSDSSKFKHRVLRNHSHKVAPKLQFCPHKGASRPPQPTTNTNCMPFRNCRHSLSKPGIEIQGKAWEYQKEAIQLSHLLFGASNFPLIKIAPKLEKLSSRGCLPTHRNQLHRHQLHAFRNRRNQPVQTSD